LPCKKVDNKIQGNNQIKPKIITAQEYEYFKSIAMEGLMTKDEKQLIEMNNEEKKKKLYEECMKRKEEIRKMDFNKINNNKLNNKIDLLEDDIRQKKLHILERANDLKLEQEEEIQICNKLILATKCRAIRDAQVAEKKLIEKELIDEEKRLNDMMENERLLKIKDEEKKLNDELIRKKKFAILLRNQIIENEEKRFIEFEKKQEEGKLINKINEAWQNDETQKAINKKIERDKIRCQIAEENNKLIQFKEIEREEAKILDMRIREYQKQKEEREKEIEEKKRIEKHKKDNEKLKIAEKSMETRNYQEKIDELNATRIQEEVERNWRKREKEAAINKLKQQQKLIDARNEQIKCRKIIQAMEIERDKLEFNKILKIQKEALCRDKKERENKLKQSQRYRIQILKQVNDKEIEKIETRKKMFEEGIALRAELEMRKKKLKNAIEKKCEIMRDNKVPEIYINEVKNLIEKIK
ncbi:cilia- and flagella-associated protein 45, partial [Aphidius gifuensis]